MLLNRLLGVRSFSRCSNQLQQTSSSMKAVSGRLRIIPKLQTFYSANPMHDNNINRLESLLRKYIKLPSQSALLKTHGDPNARADINTLLQSQNGSRPLWMSFKDYTIIGGGSRLKPTQYTELVFLLNKLHNIDPQLINDDIKAELARYYKHSSAEFDKVKIPKLDEFGRSVGIGRRKSATAKVFVVRGEGKVLVNNRQLNDYFVKLKDREAVMYPLQVINAIRNYNVFVTTSGGGPTGQADAAGLAIGKAMIAFNPLLKTRLHRAGCLTTDYRRVERKKPGKLKARKSPTWVKR
ncbi:similar to Saccharomyces cerevisiae YBR146W MRPS9 Mitochondrial ribosomal protein of the small subunit [Maudiozyma barnettii]|uniref:Small ribosomal subunit protein uS9m n=1 Tax=Maudiozyma barnettii TaxID=61262 RepID=A0A8H2VEH7_9SACH|nr:mitochondrial 37S ribosomal protein MRPS9 [Kazachstania barnettii]CAB4253624.1 similar to Saccharomyces cerevisiae YBR146W MRPS9 Mitochondrial ribosomal protein of the small subunit [Kazachstania barnettii]CAD1781300.1 similar to Saccharomyces cerevisiae YBR146W MRPS9 Mitochondrial ribosomal protein of the small subunit [Kazachstania barnettii]